MKEPKNSWLGYAAIFLTAAALVGYVVSRPKPPEVFAPPAGSVYYTGPMLNKQGGYGTPDGRLVAGPQKLPAEKTSKQNLIELDDL